MPSPTSFLLAFTSEQTSHGVEHPFGQFGSLWSPGYVPSHDPAHPSLLAFGVRGMLERRPWCCASAAQPEPERWRVTSTSLATDTKNSARRAAVGNVTSISARPSTGICKYTCEYIYTYIYIHIYKNAVCQRESWWKTRMLRRGESC